MREKNAYSRIIQNVTNWREEDKNLKKGEMIALLHCCIEQGITSFESGDFSGNLADRTFGTALSESGLSRDDIQLISKYRDSRSGKDLTAAVDDLLITLKTDYLDLLLLDFPEHPEELMEDIGKFSSQGKVLEIGGIDLQDSQVNSFSKILPARANEIKLDFFSSEEKNPLQNLNSSSPEITQIISFNYGTSSTDAGRNKVYQELASKYEVENYQLFLCWILQHQSHLHPVITFSDEEKIKKAAAAKDVRLDPIDWQKINLLLS